MFIKDSNQYFICLNILIGCVCLFAVVVLFVYLLLWKRNMTTEYWLSHSRCLRVVFFSVTQDSSICIQFYFEDDNSAGLTKYQLLSFLSDNVVRCYDAVVMIYMMITWCICKISIFLDVTILSSPFDWGKRFNSECVWNPYTRKKFQVIIDKSL